MSPAQDKPPTYDELITALLRPATGPVPAADLVDRMLAARPSGAKNARRAMRQHLRQAAGRVLVFLDEDRVAPLRLAFQGARFRLPLDGDAIRQGLVNLEHFLPSYLPPQFPLERLRLVDAVGQPIAFQVEMVAKPVSNFLGSTTINARHANLSAWLRAEQANAQDHLLFTILDWENGHLQLEREPFEQRDQSLLAQRNRLLADVFFDLLEQAAREAIYEREAVPAAYARLPDKSGCPPDHWLAVVEADERLTTDGWRIHYADSGLSPLERLAAELWGEPQRAPAQRVSKAQGAPVYRFRAELARRPEVWRTIEIQGKHTLADLDTALRGAFNHDMLDHLGGFWKLVARGKPARAARRGRQREVELGDVNPLGEGPGAAVQVAGLDLAAGDQLKYVYDFGDWIEHRLTLEAVTPPQPKVKYPREVARNTPKPADCVECRAQGRKTAAKWICLECSDQRGGEVLICDQCARKRHDEHYLEELLY